MSRPQLYEPDIVASALQAVAILALAVTPLLLSIKLRRTIIPVSLTVPLLATTPPPIEQPDVPDIKKLNEEVKQAAEQRREAELARKAKADKKKQAEAEQLRQDEEKKKHEAKLAEQKRQEEEARKRQQQEQQRLEQKRQKREAEQQKRLKDEQQRQAENQTKHENRLNEQQRASLIGRYTAGIQNRVYRRMSNPDNIATDIKVEIRVRLDADGKLVGTPAIERSSGNSAYDTLAVRAIIRASEGGFDLPTDPELREQFGDLILILSPKQ